MQFPTPGAHPDCVTARPVSSGPASDASARELARAAVDAVQAVGGFAGGVYLRSGAEGPLLLAVLTGLPGRLFRPWWRMHVNRPYPVAEAYRSGQPVHLPDADAAMRRFPQMMAGLPFPFGSVYEPVMAGAHRFGVLFVLRPATPGGRVDAVDRERLRSAADGLGASLAALASAGDPVTWTGDPVCVPPPDTAQGAREAVERLSLALLSMDRGGRIRYVNRAAAVLLGLGAPELRGRVVWEAVPWLGQPAYEDHFRRVFMSAQPVRFPARRGRQQSGDWVTVALYPSPDGVTVTIGPADPPVYPPGSAVRAGTGLDSPADRASALYRPVALAIALTEAVTARQVSAVVTQELLPAFGGRQLAIYLLNERHLHLAWETGFPQGFLDRFDGVALDARLPGVETLTTGRPMFFESMEHLAAAYPGIPLDAHVGARAFLPLIASGRPVGSCILGFDAPRGFSPEERTVLTALAGLIAQALERAQRYDSEAALARGLQAALLPHRLPVRENVQTVGRYLPGTQGMDVGGDWYDVVETTDGLLALVIGDVQGHGVAAAATMGQLRSAVRAFTLGGSPPEQVVAGTNRLLIDLDPGQFASCCYVLLDPVSGRARAVRAGHPQPLLRHADGRAEVLDLPGGMVLGIDADASYPVTELRLAPGAVFALYTDGLVEEAGEDIDLGVERLRAALAAARPSPLTELADRLVGEAGDFADRPDDIALLLASRTKGAPAASATGAA
ncbi:MULTISPECIES: SpoIIE family protein phosphatase [unclassified Streptomyces]|uniref:SpoIIE family protein phosphatase n=1 Tax=unclassified Streptomyces TaxID=2593676 RepID=UPI002E0D33FD|nr:MULTISPECIES: SpoIIE family protein phosphatase [unclassified Streptomyces]WSR24586.1 SpoIIE family protein phosphatase [Streptomyces sp. NBC_01205]